MIMEIVIQETNTILSILVAKWQKLKSMHLIWKELSGLLEERFINIWESRIRGMPIRIKLFSGDLASVAYNLLNLIHITKVHNI